MSELTKEKLDELERMWTEAQPILRGAPTLAGSELALREGVAVGNYLVTMNAQVPALLAAAREAETLRAEVARLTEELASAKRYEEAEYNGRAAAVCEVENLTEQLAERDAALATAQAEVERLAGTLAPVRVMHAECPKCGANPAVIVTPLRLLTPVVAEPAYEPQNGDLDLTPTGLRLVLWPEADGRMNLACVCGHEWKGQCAT